jgi:hypothetical protein
VKEKIERKITELDEAAQRKIEADAVAVCERYGWNIETIVKEASKFEKQMIWRCGWPMLEKELKACWDFAGHDIIRIVLEKLIYPIVLCGDKSKEDKYIVLGIDHLWTANAYPELWKRFHAEIAAFPKYEDNPEGWGNSRLSDALVADFAKATAELEEFKDALRAKTQKEDEEDARLCAEEEESSED